MSRIITAEDSIMHDLSDEYVLREGDSLEFLDPHGFKGAGHVYRSKVEIMDAFKLDDQRYEELVSLGLPIITLSDGSVLMTEYAFDQWSEEIAGITRKSDAAIVTPVKTEPGSVVISRERFTVECLGKTCPLGNTKVFRLAERLHAARGNYVSYGSLVKDVWDGDSVENATIHQAVKVLRRKLRAAGMAEVVILAQPDHYALQIRV
jgi:hypothetical protein